MRLEHKSLKLLQQTATDCNRLQQTATCCSTYIYDLQQYKTRRNWSTSHQNHCNSLQQTAAYCSTLQHYPPDPINHVCSLTGRWISKNHFTYRSVQIFKILFQGFILQNLILRTRLCGTGFITQPSCVFDFRFTEICQAEMICIGGVPVLKRYFSGASI